VRYIDDASALINAQSALPATVRVGIAALPVQHRFVGSALFDGLFHAGLQYFAVSGG
jgi:hypothetical protein